MKKQFCFESAGLSKLISDLSEQPYDSYVG